jgi:hypothetical protein
MTDAQAEIERLKNECAGILLDCETLGRERDAAIRRAERALETAQLAHRNAQAAQTVIAELTDELKVSCDSEASLTRRLTALRTAVAEHMERNPTGAGILKLNAAIKAAL